MLPREHGVGEAKSWPSPVFIVVFVRFSRDPPIMQRHGLGGARKDRSLSLDNIAMQAKHAEAASSSGGGDPSAAMPRLSLEGERTGSPESGVQPRATAGAAGAALVPRSSSMWKGRRHRSVSWDDLPQKLPAGAPSEISSVEEEGSGTSYGSFDSSSDQRSRSSSICSIDEDSQVSRFGWQPDAEVQRCSIPGCDRQFSLVHRRHHCRKCGRVVCSNCSKRRIRSERVCLECCQLGAVSEETTETHAPAAFEPASHASGAAAVHGAGLLDGRSPRESPAATPITRSPLESPALHGMKVPVSALPSAVAAKLNQVNRATAGGSGAGALHWKDMGPLGVGAAGGFGGASQDWTSGSGSHEWEDSLQMQAGAGTTSASPTAMLLDEGEPFGDASSDDASSAEDDGVVAQHYMQQQTSGWGSGGGSGTKGSARPLRRSSSGMVDSRTGAWSKSTSATSLKGYGASLWRSSSSSSIASLARGTAPALSAGVGGGRADGGGGGGRNALPSRDASLSGSLIVGRESGSASAAGAEADNAADRATGMRPTAASDGFQKPNWHSWVPGISKQSTAPRAKAHKDRRHLDPDEGVSSPLEVGDAKAGYMPRRFTSLCVNACVLAWTAAVRVVVPFRQKAVGIPTLFLRKEAAILSAAVCVNVSITSSYLWIHLWLSIDADRCIRWATTEGYLSARHDRSDWKSPAASPCSSSPPLTTSCFGAGGTLSTGRVSFTISALQVAPAISSILPSPAVFVLNRACGRRARPPTSPTSMPTS